MTVDKETVKKIDAEAKRRYPENWRHTTPSERVAVFDDGLDSRSAFVAGAYYAMDEYSSSLQKEVEYWKARCEAAEDVIGVERTRASAERLGDRSGIEAAYGKWQALKQQPIK